MKLSIVVLNYNTKDLTIQTINSVLSTVVDIEYDLFLVDNASSDDSRKEFEKVFGDKSNIKFIWNEENIGFSAGNNVAIKEAKGEYLLLLNSDTIVKQEAIKKCVEYMDKHLDIGAIGPKISLGDGRLDHACKRGFPTPEASMYYMLGLDKKYPKNKKYGKYRMTHLNEDCEGEVDALTGAFMMVRKTVIDKIGMLDERFFMFAEDIDWCYRIKKEGWKVYYYPEAEIVHLKGQSRKKKRRYASIYQMYKTMLQFYNKHYIKNYNFIITICVYIGIGLKFVLSVIKNFLIRD